MRGATLCIALLLVAGAAALVPSKHIDLPDLFAEYAEKYQREYRSPVEREQALENFKANFYVVEFLNTHKEASYDLGPFFDMTSMEFQSKMLLPRQQLPDEFLNSQNYLEEANVSAVPAAFDWRSKGAVTAVKDQGSAGSCWAFSTTGNIEGQHFLSTKTLTAFSEEQLVDCDDTDCGVFGGWPYHAYDFVKKAGGLQKEADYPYCAGTKDNTCYPCMADKNKTFCGPGPEYCNRNCSADPSKYAVKVAGWSKVSTDAAQIQAQLMSVGPLSVLIDASTLQFYHHGVWDPLSCSSTSLDHAVLLVGWGEEDGLFGKKPFWLVKNSWGGKWGEDGYFRIIRGKGKCGINTAVTTSHVAA